MNYQFEAHCKFDGLYLFETSQDEAKSFIEKGLKRELRDFNIIYKEAPSGLCANIKEDV